jgi:hypothetical protein
MLSRCFQGLGPWNLNLQLVGPRESETVPFTGIDTAQRRLRVVVPKDVNREGGSFEINIGRYLCSSKILYTNLLRFSERRGLVRMQAYALCTRCHR